MDTAPWPQEIVVKPMEEMIGGGNTCSSSVTTTPSPNIFSNNTNNNNNNNNINGKVSSTSLERKVRPEKDQALNCPRCNSTNTKFCYYNNYSLTQPRYFCKTCRRYWTEGGSLRNIPVGGGSRKNKRSSSSNSSSSNTSPPSSKKFLSHDPHLLTPPNTNHNTNIHPHQGQDLNLGFPPTHQDQFRSLSEFIQLPNLETNPAGNNTQVHDSASVDPSSGVNAAASSNMSALELLNGLASSRGLTPFMPMPVPDPNGVYSSGLMSLHDFKPTLNFSLDGLGNGYGSLSSGVQQQETAVNNGRLLFPFEDCNNKTVSNNTASTDHDHENANTNTNTAANDQTRDHGDSTGYWTGMLGTSGSW